MASPVALFQHVDYKYIQKIISQALKLAIRKSQNKNINLKNFATFLRLFEFLAQKIRLARFERATLCLEVV